ncbi:hypothetical protein CAC42_4533 [Sphaceloma murrayae]|uniref:Mitotic checkpoint regulator, MAD2B-interacting-domain-containing protein n=1 Tax=Sphaceloma murrayae TaxID=2082308 RepID=A0A2K1QMF8_9PEZI|nr:hypothetical protein CAC42_4533 [Sphaceloma murrayae]
MALVGYSDSEGSDADAPSAPKPSSVPKAGKPAFEKLVESTGPRKIKVDLPKVASTIDTNGERPTKRLRTGGGLSGFNALLPAPKRTAETGKRTGLGSGISLRTSSAAAFSREPADDRTANDDDSEPTRNRNITDGTGGIDTKTKPAGSEEVKIVGNAMRFRPLSVANKKKAKTTKSRESVASISPSVAAEAKGTTSEPSVAPPKAKVSLFSVSQEDKEPNKSSAVDAYEPMFDRAEEVAESAGQTYDTDQPAVPDPNSLDAVAADLNLTAADRRRLFGRNGQGAQAVSISNFNTDAEYTKNEQLRAAGEAVQHRAVRAVAPGKHSLKQLVNMASNQKEALEDAWAEGKRNRGEAGNKYGWGN